MDAVQSYTHDIEWSKSGSRAVLTRPSKLAAAERALDTIRAALVRESERREAVENLLDFIEQNAYPTSQLGFDAIACRLAARCRELFGGEL